MVAGLGVAPSISSGYEPGMVYVSVPLTRNKFIRLETCTLPQSFGEIVAAMEHGRILLIV